LRDATGLSNRAPTPLRTSAAGLLGRRLAAAPPALGAEDLLVKLADAKFVTLSGVAGSAAPTAADFSGVSTRTLVLGGPGSAVPADTTPALAAGMVDGNALLAVGEIFTSGGEVTERDEWIDEIAGDDALRNHLIDFLVTRSRDLALHPEARPADRNPPVIRPTATKAHEATAPQLQSPGQAPALLAS